MAGRAKTRLIPLLGPRGAADLQRALILDTISKVDKLARRAEPWLFVTGGDVPEIRGHARWKLAFQRGSGLGERLETAFRKLLRLHPSALIIGTDSPLMTPRLLRLALSELIVCDAVLGPCPDGGFYLIGLRCEVPGLFPGVRLGTRHAFGDVLRALMSRGLSSAVLPPVTDIDRPQDLREIATAMRVKSALCAAARGLWRFLMGARPSRPRSEGKQMAALPARKPSRSSPRR